VGAFGVDLDKASPVRATLFEKRDGSAFLLKWDRWVAELSATQGKELLADLQAALGTTKD
jgi:hypothetical protein